MFSENEVVLEIYGMVKDQVLVSGMSGEIIGLNHLAVWEAIDRFGVEDGNTVFQRVNMLADHIYAIEREKR